MMYKQYYRLLQVFKDNLPLPKQDLVLVYTMRKVASTTLTNTLRSNGLLVYKQHCLNQDNYLNFSKSLKIAGEPKPHWLVDGNRFHRRLQLWRRYRGNHRCKIITLIRDPLSLCVSDIFMHTFTMDLLAEFPKQAQRLDFEKMENLVPFVFERLTKAADNFPIADYFKKLVEFPNSWFNSELRSIFEVDVLQSGFPKEKGYHVYKGEYADVLLLRSEDINKIGRFALNEFLELDLERLDDRNVTVEQDHALLYQQLKASLKLPREFLDGFYSESYVHYFYTEAEIEKFKSIWL